MFWFLGIIKSMWQYVVNFPRIVLLGSVVIWTNSGNYRFFVSILQLMSLEKALTE